tara:strand:+ start:854 stop:1753 length:900 start_codon:yes stop_codon:yes gene_type:complete
LLNSFNEEAILPFTLQNNIVRGRIGFLNQSINESIKYHNYPKNISYLIAQSLMIMSLIGETIKLKWKISLQIRSEGPIKLICVDYFAPKEKNEKAKIRAYASFKKNITKSKKDPFKMLEKGLMSISIDQGNGSKPYQGIINLSGNNISDSVCFFFLQSEQLPTFFKIVLNSDIFENGNHCWNAFGIMVQYMPKNKGEIINENDYLHKVKTLINTLELSEMLYDRLSHEMILNRLFHNENCIVFKKQEVAFGCTCNIKKVKEILKNFNNEDIKNMTDEKKDIHVDCEFCGKRYSIKENDI